MSNSILKKIKIILLITTCVYCISSCNLRQIPNGTYKGKIEEYTYHIDFRDDGSILLKKYNTLNASVLERRVGSYEPLIEKFDGIWEKQHIDKNYIKVIINDDMKSSVMLIM